MSPVIVLVKKDLRSFFGNPLFYLIAGLCALIWSPIYIYAFGVYLTEVVSHMGQTAQDTTYHERVLIEFVYLVNFVFIVFVNGITMKLIAEERKNNTYTLLMTSPMTARQLIVAKFISGYGIMSVLLVVAFAYPLTTSFLGHMQWGPLLTSYLGLFLFSGVYISLGLLASSLCSSVIMAFLLALIFNLALWFVGVGAEMSTSDWAVSFFQYTNLEPIFKSFSLGVIRLSSVFYLVCIMIFACFCSERVLQWGRWR